MGVDLVRGIPSLKGATPMKNAQARGKHAKESQGWRLEDEENRLWEERT